ncbi:MAG: hypothetical protein BWY82_01865 [Verrucomicrobia bacterium ADurb.Bin474]|nr:MAG: hypothetical protein BWY82_01865 [Verrucomicrobia bacterium ADurb.Bin474]
MVDPASSELVLIGDPVRVGAAFGSGRPFQVVRTLSKDNPLMLGSLLDGPRLPMLSPGVVSNARIADSGVSGIPADKMGARTPPSNTGCAGTRNG